MLTADDRREIKLWIYDRSKEFHDTVAKAAERKPELRHASEKDFTSRAVFITCGKFGLSHPDDIEAVRKIADTVSQMAWVPSAMIVTETFRLSREDLLDIAFWANRTDGYAASAVQVSNFMRSVIRGNLSALHEERVPPTKIRIKRRKRP